MKLKHALLIFIVSAFAFVGTAQAQTGVFYDRTIVGEGITVFESLALNGDNIRTAYFYTYGAEECELLGINQTVTANVSVTATATATAVCPNSIFYPFNPLCDPVTVEVTETETASNSENYIKLSEVCDLNGQRWFLMSDPIDKEGDSTGKIYITEGIDFPKCIPSVEPFEEDVSICTKPEHIGNYILRPMEDGGFAMWVQSLDPEFPPPGDPLYNHPYYFDTVLVLPEQAQPK